MYAKQYLIHCIVGYSGQFAAATIKLFLAMLACSFKFFNKITSNKNRLPIRSSPISVILISSSPGPVILFSL